MTHTTLLQYLRDYTRYRLQAHFGQEIVQEPAMPTWEADNQPLTLFLKENNLSTAEVLTLALALSSHALPNLVDDTIRAALPNMGDFPELGGVKGTNHRGLLPTGETAIFLIAGNDLNKRIATQQLFATEHFFYKKRILWLESMKEGEPATTGRIIMDEEYIELFLHGRVTMPKFSTEFPAEHILTPLEWKDLVLPDATKKSIEDIKLWIEHHETLMNDWGMSRHVKPGYRALFHGPPGTGKTLTSLLIGKHTKKEVFRIDLSKLFDKAENKDWILFFDEADAIFGKRTGVRDAHDKYANQEVSYLLQRVENYPGLVILASNFKSNIDDAFMRRFQSVIYFSLPKAEERQMLWQNALPKNISFEPSIDAKTLAQKYELSGSQIVNVVHYAALQAIARKGKVLLVADLIEGIRLELIKDGKML
jgi:ATPase family associated with various cellular activities (AAA)